MCLSTLAERESRGRLDLAGPNDGSQAGESGGELPHCQVRRKGPGQRGRAQGSVEQAEDRPQRYEIKITH